MKVRGECLRWMQQDFRYPIYGFSLQASQVLAAGISHLAIMTTPSVVAVNPDISRFWSDHRPLARFVPTFVWGRGRGQNLSLKSFLSSLRPASNKEFWNQRVKFVAPFSLHCLYRLVNQIMEVRALTKWCNHWPNFLIDELITRFPVIGTGWAARHGLLLVNGDAAAILTKKW